MAFFFIVLTICFVLFLFRLYHVANDDAVLVKKNVSLQMIFDVAFIVAIFSLLSARLVFVLLNPDPIYLNPLVFLIFPYFPGLSLLGGFVGGALTLFLYGRYKKFPQGRVFDFFTVAFTFVLPLGLLGFFLLSGEFSLGGMVRLALFTVMGLATNLYFQPKARSLEIKDGTISILFLIFLSLTMLLTGSIDKPGIYSFIHGKESVVYSAFLLLGIILFVKQEFLGRKGTKSGK